MAESTLIHGPLHPSSPIVQAAVSILAEAATPTRIILFGSAARGDVHPDSDLDFLVVLSSTQDTWMEMVRLSEALSSIPFPIDVLVYSEQDVANRGHLKGTALYHALREGTVLY